MSGFTGQSGLQPERTALAWQRTSLALLANGGLFALRAPGGPRIGPGVVLAAALLGLALLVAVLGRRRERVLSRAQVPHALRPAAEVTVIGWLVAAVCLGGVLVLALPA